MSTSHDYLGGLKLISDLGDHSQIMYVGKKLYVIVRCFMEEHKEYPYHAFGTYLYFFLTEEEAAKTLKDRDNLFEVTFTAEGKLKPIEWRRLNNASDRPESCCKEDGKSSSQVKSNRSRKSK